MEGMQGNTRDGRFRTRTARNGRRDGGSSLRDAKNGRSSVPDGHVRALRERLAAATAQLLADASVPRLD